MGDAGEGGGGAYFEVVSSIAVNDSRLIKHAGALALTFVNATLEDVYKMMPANVSSKLPANLTSMLPDLTSVLPPMLPANLSAFLPADLITMLPSSLPAFHELTSTHVLLFAILSFALVGYLRGDRRLVLLVACCALLTLGKVALEDELGEALARRWVENADLPLPARVMYPCALLVALLEWRRRLKVAKEVEARRLLTVRKAEVTKAFRMETQAQLEELKAQAAARAEEGARVEAERQAEEERQTKATKAFRTQTNAQLEEIKALIAAGPDRAEEAEKLDHIKAEVESMQAKLDELLAGDEPEVTVVEIDDAVIDDLAAVGVVIPWSEGMASDKLYVQPPSRQVELKVLRKGESPCKVGTVIESAAPPANTADQPIKVDDLQTGEHVVQPFVRLGALETDSKIFMLMALKTFKVTVGARGLTWVWSDGATGADDEFPNFVDTRLQHTKTTFANNGVPLKDRVKCVLTMKPGFGSGGKVTFIRELDASGAMDAVLAPDFVVLVELYPLSDPSQVASIPATPQPPVNPKKPAPPQAIENDPRPPSALPKFQLAHTVFMGDVSGSMREGDRMEKLRKGFREAVERYSKAETPYALCTWDSRIFWPPGGQRWLGKGDKESILSWVNGLNHQGPNDMRYAIEQVVKVGVLKDTVRHLVVMCDGDIKPFAVDKKGKHGQKVDPNSSFHTLVKEHDSEATEEADDWQAFVDTLPPNVRSVSFVAFSKDGDARMQRMATISRGNFYDF